MLNLGHEPGMAGQALRCQRASKDMRMRSVVCWILGKCQSWQAKRSWSQGCLLVGIEEGVPGSWMQSKRLAIIS